MNVGVTGASGHLGSTICRKLLKKGYQVIAFIHHNDEGIANLPIKIIKGNILDKKSLTEFISQCDAIIHTAGAIELSYKFNQTLQDINVTGTKNVLTISKDLGISKVVFTSSIHVYQQKPYDIQLDETRPFVSNNSVFYDQTKRDAHQLAIKAAKNGLNVSIVCPSAVIGPYDFKPSKLGKAIIDIYKGKFPALFKGGFDFVDVRDIADGTIAALEKGKAGASYILSGKYYTIKEFSDIIYEIKGVRKRLVALPLTFAYIGLPFVKLVALLTRTTPIYDKLYVDVLKEGNKFTSFEKANKKLGYKPRPLKETLFDTIHWFKEEKKL